MRDAENSFENHIICQKERIALAVYNTIRRQSSGFADSQAVQVTTFKIHSKPHITVHRMMD